MSVWNKESGKRALLTSLVEALKLITELRKVTEQKSMQPALNEGSLQGCNL